MALHFENYLSIRQVYPRQTPNIETRLEVRPPANRTELDYRELLSEANVNYFHREYTIALEHYLELRNKILVQSHPEMPAAPRGGSSTGILPSSIQFSRIVELSRRYLLLAKPGGPVPLPLSEIPMIQPGEFPVNPEVAKLAGIGLDPKTAGKSALIAQRDAARAMVVDGDITNATKVYAAAAQAALNAGDIRVAAEFTAEVGVMQATYAEGATRAAVLKQAATNFTSAQTLFGQAGDVRAQDLMKANMANVQSELQPTAPIVAPGLPAFPIGTISFPTRLAIIPKTARTYQLVEGDAVKSAASTVAAGVNLKSSDREVGLYTTAGVKAVNLARTQYETTLTAQFYTPRITATDIDSLQFNELIQTNFVAYIPHLFFYVLPLAIGDTYLAMGRYQNALTEYQSALAYPFLNRGIEGAVVWLRMAKACQAWGDYLFRAGNSAAAKIQYEKIILTNLTVSVASPLYASAAFVPMRTIAAEAVKQIKAQPHADVNPAVVQAIMKANVQLTKIANNLNFLGIGANEFSIFRFKFLQSAANYMADNAIQSERTFVNFRSQAEAQKLERIQLQSSVDMNKAALKVEQKRMEDSALEAQAASQTRQLAELRQQHTQDSLNDWNTKGWELATINGALSWASNAANDQDITYTGIRYRGETHDFDTDVEQFYDVLSDWKENLDFELQQTRLQRARDESIAETGIARTREQQAFVRRQIQQLNVDLAQVRLQGSQEMLEYATDRMFDEDLWFKLAADMQDLVRDYLDMAIYSAFLMERAYELEFDRRLNRIRLDYSIGNTEGLLGGDHLKRDIAYFTIDYLEHAQKKNPVRLAISLRDEFPAAYSSFVTTGVLPFRTDLEIFDRRLPGTYRRKIKKVEIFVEGLIPLEGALGYLHNQGLSSEWRASGGAWVKQTRVLPVDRMPLSSYQFRRDITVFAPSEEMLGVFENLGPQCNWTLELPLSANNLDYQAISDVKFVLYFDADQSADLRAFLKTFYPATAGKIVILSSRFHFPDQYFRLDADRKVAFELHPSRFPYNYTSLGLKGFSIRVIPKAGKSTSGVQMTITRGSDNSSVAVTANAAGLVLSDPSTMAPFAAWKGKTPADTFTVAFANSVDLSVVDDVQLSVSYKFGYRADAPIV